jgi:hypothetical protein
METQSRNHLNMPIEVRQVMMSVRPEELLG